MLKLIGTLMSVPGVMPGWRRASLLGAAALVFVTVAGSFAVPQALGTPAGFATMPRERPGGTEGRGSWGL
jgi:ABC-type Fe3+ transport system permease subunit